jgi:hypothetical protein
MPIKISHFVITRCASPRNDERKDEKPKTGSGKAEKQ